MEEEDLKLLTRFISAWMWHISAIVFLSLFIVLLVLQKYIFAFGIVGVVIVCEVFAWKRAKEAGE